YHGDCLEVMAALEPGFDLVFTSPPYNLGESSGGDFKGIKRDAKSKWDGGRLADGYGAHSDRMPYPEYVEWQKRVLGACWRLLSPAGAVFYNHKPRVQDGIVRLPLDLNPGLPVRQIVIWARAGGINFSPAFYLPTHEWIVVFAKAGWALKSKGASGVGDVWEITQEQGNPHPAPFPVQLPGRALETTGARSVLDPFCGSGTTLLAAKLAGVRGVGIELEERFCEMAARRLSQETLPLFEAAS
ncbi:MAG TPA: site-specific DNA-methyltransferase, partial [Acidimicrobiales bacterium]|nr:site-specific DNA-methyltransferase [Acidimicrobiales bacterium]